MRPKPDALIRPNSHHFKLHEAMQFGAKDLDGVIYQKAIHGRGDVTTLSIMENEARNKIYL